MTAAAAAARPLSILLLDYENLLLSNAGLAAPRALDSCTYVCMNVDAARQIHRYMDRLTSRLPDKRCGKWTALCVDSAVCVYACMAWHGMAWHGVSCHVMYCKVCMHVNVCMHV